MNTFYMSDMQYAYHWTARPQDNPKFRSGADNLKFNRNQGYEMLHVVNQFLKQKRLKSVVSVRRVEKLIKEKCLRGYLVTRKYMTGRSRSGNDLFVTENNHVDNYNNVSNLLLIQW